MGDTGGPEYSQVLPQVLCVFTDGGFCDLPRLPREDLRCLI